MWHTRGMARTRLSTTVDAELLDTHGVCAPTSPMPPRRRGARSAASLHRAAEVDAGYAAYDAHPLDEPDAWGDLASFRRAAAAS